MARAQAPTARIEKAPKNAKAGKTVAASKPKKSVAKAPSKRAKLSLIGQLDALQSSTSIKFCIPSAPKARTAHLESAELLEMDLDPDAEFEQGDDDDESLDLERGLDDQELDELEDDGDGDAVDDLLPSPPSTASKKKSAKNTDAAKGA
jgi:hypothetical protein